MAGIDPKFYYLTLGLLVLCTIVGMAVAYSFQREVNNDLAPPTEKDLLGPLEQAYYSGLMREEEFHKIRESMARQKGTDATPTIVKGRRKPAEVPDQVLGDLGSMPTPPSPVSPPDGSDPGLGPG